MKHLLILCNALDDRTRTERGIATDSPAASRKIFMMARALRHANVAATVISLGRGRGTTSTRWWPAVARRSSGVATTYIAFVDRALLSYLVSLVALAVAVAVRVRRGRRPTILVYNRSLAYVPALILARAYGLRIVLDLEDGYTGSGASLRERTVRLGNRLFDALCGGRALLACSALGSATHLGPTMVYYGVSDGDGRVRPPAGETVTALLGGTVTPETGGDLLADAVVELRREAPAWAQHLVLEITGKGQSIERLTDLAGAPGAPLVRVWGRTTDAEYDAIRNRVDVGLALKLNGGTFAHTTFPSKVIEMAAAGQMVLTTDISDVRTVLGSDGARFVSQDTPAALIAELRWTVLNRAAAATTAARGTAAVAALCEPAVAGQRLAAFLFPGNA